MDKLVSIPRKTTVQYELVLSSVMVNTVIFRKVLHSIVHLSSRIL